MIQALLRRACERGELRLLDLHLGLFLEKPAGVENGHPELLLAASLASAAVGSGHVCLPLERAEELGPQPLPDFTADVEKWRESLLATPVVGAPGSTAPLILDAKNRLYLYRYFCYEEQVAEDLSARAERAMIDIDADRAAQLLERLFGPANDTIDDQKTAAAMALLKGLLVISGGPGTGKTHTVARILALVRAMEGNSLRIGLAAPTGKAAARLEESIRKAAASLPPDLTHELPHRAHTLHRLLGFRPGGRGFRYNRDNPLHLDLLVLDEASMIDIVLMDALLQALPLKCRLILLGDHHQLASVEAGSLFGDLCGSGQAAWSAQLCSQLQPLIGAAPALASPGPSAMADCVITLRTSYRFTERSGIGALAAAVNSGDTDKVASLLAGPPADDLAFCTLQGRRRREWLEAQLSAGFAHIHSAAEPEAAFGAMEAFRCLCATRKGDLGVEEINSLARQVLVRRGYIPRRDIWYRGRPLIIRRNHYEMQLFNGDTGIVWPDEEGRLRAWFMRPDNRLQPFALSRLPDHDTAYGVTIHKAQGSEFERILLLLPDEESRMLSRELLYTGITRARNRLTICATPAAFAAAVRRQTLRFSGLADKLHSDHL